MTRARPDVFLLAGRDRRLVGGHPWVYSNEVRMDANAKSLEPGCVVTLRRMDGKPLGIGTFNPHVLIAYRQFAGDVQSDIDGEFIAGRLSRALALRQKLYADPYYRLIHGEADGLPGLVVDRFGDLVVVQCATAGTSRLVPSILAAVDRVLNPATVVFRNDGAFRDLEGLPHEVQVAKGSASPPIPVVESGLRFAADPLGGQKTGWFFDQRDNRAFVARLAAGLRVLDLYCHTGGFGVSAAAQGALSVLGIDSSEPALALAREASVWNGQAARCEFVRDNVYAALERLAAESATFGAVVADPPAFVKSRKDLKPGLSGYRKLARLTAGRVAPGGFLFIASCSHNVDFQAFQDEVARGLTQAGRTGRVLRASGAGADHPLHPHLAESAYLTALTLQLD